MDIMKKTAVSPSHLVRGMFLSLREGAAPLHSRLLGALWMVVNTNCIKVSKVPAPLSSLQEREGAADGFQLTYKHIFTYFTIASRTKLFIMHPPNMSNAPFKT
jgi:hypothetical protein